MKILVTTICFIQDKDKYPDAELYGKYANRLIESCMKNSSFDIRVATNRPDVFLEAVNRHKGRVFILQDDLSNNKIRVGHFNQLLKFIAFKDIPAEYDYILYVDCDSGFINEVDNKKIEDYVIVNQTKGFNGAAARADVDYLERELTEEANGRKGMFNNKFLLYGLTLENLPHEWKNSSMPCEHILFLKNDPDKVKAVSDKIAEFNSIFENQLIENNGPVLGIDMEAFEIGVSLNIAGYKCIELSTGEQQEIFGIGYNASNLERIKV